ncbi:MAG TPA: OsmC family protein [Terriglobales bacterium]|nr:OsmC family protein [Terriglobales bacterium]
METVYRYRTTAHWSAHRTGIVEAEEIPRTINFSAPPEFGGDPGLWTPEHLLAAALATCFVSTFRAVADASKLEVLALAADVDGVLEKGQSGFSFTEYRLRPKLTIAREEDRERAGRLLAKAEHVCLVTRSLSGRVEMQAEILVGEAVPAR